MSNLGIVSAKQEMRLAMRALRRTFPRQRASADSQAAQSLLMSMPEFKAARIICCYLAMPGETDTALVLGECLRSGRITLVPAFRPETGCYALAFYDASTPIAPGPGNAPQPTNPVWADETDPGFWVAPGLAFDAEGGRLGQGMGHYDRMLSAGQRPAFRVGLAFSWQMAPKIPMDAHDVPLDAIVTESCVFRPNQPNATPLNKQTLTAPAGGTV